MGASVAGRVSGGFFIREQHCKFPDQGSRENFSLSLLKPAILASPLVTWTLQTQINIRYLIAAGLPPTSSLCKIGLHDHGAKSHNIVHSFRFRRRREPGIFARGGDAPVSVEEAAEDSKAVREASWAPRSLISSRKSFPLISFLVLSLLILIGNLRTSRQESAKPKLERSKKRLEPFIYWAYIICLVLCWLSVAFFLHLQVQRWESTMAMADGATTDGAFDPGGSFCHSSWPNTGLGCQISFTAI